MSRADLTMDVRVLASNLTLTAGQAVTLTTETLILGTSELLGMDWVLSTSPNLKIEILQSNSQSGPFTKWSDPSVGGDNITNDFTTTVANDGTRLVLSPSAYAQVKLTNLAVVSLTITALRVLQA